MAEKDQEQPPMLGLHNLPRPKGATTIPKRKGRGPGSGLGKTAGRGHKGQRARKSGNVRPGFEGGQMPLIRRVPKRGFHNPERTAYQVVNLADLAEVGGAEITPATLLEAGLINRVAEPVKILGAGEATQAYTVSGCAVSASAREKIERAGGQVEG